MVLVPVISPQSLKFVQMEMALISMAATCTASNYAMMPEFRGKGQARQLLPYDFSDISWYFQGIRPYFVSLMDQDGTFCTKISVDWNKGFVIWQLYPTAQPHFGRSAVICKYAWKAFNKLGHPWRLGQWHAVADKLFLLYGSQLSSLWTSVFGSWCSDRIGEIWWNNHNNFNKVWPGLQEVIALILRQALEINCVMHVRR